MIGLHLSRGGGELISTPSTYYDFSAYYKDNDKLIITSSLGRRGDVYLRSLSSGARIASNTLVNALSKLTHTIVNKCGEKELEDQIKLDIIKEWNKRTRLALRRKPLTKDERYKLKKNVIDKVKIDPYITYDSSVVGAILIGKKLVIVSIGETSCCMHNLNGYTRLFNYKKHYLCDETLYSHIDVKVVNTSGYLDVVLLTKGENIKDFDKHMLSKDNDNTKTIGIADDYKD